MNRRDFFKFSSAALFSSFVSHFVIPVVTKATQDITPAPVQVNQEYECVFGHGTIHEWGPEGLRDILQRRNSELVPDVSFGDINPYVPAEHELTGQIVYTNLNNGEVYMTSNIWEQVPIWKRISNEKLLEILRKMGD